MSSLRRTISAGVSTGVAVIALSLIASAPAASGRSTHARPFLTDGGTNVIQTVDRGRSLFDRHADSSIRSTSTVQLSASGFQAMKGGLARVVVETDRPGRVAQDVTSLGGRVERSWRNLIQVAIPRGKLSALSARPAVDAVRAPYSRVEHAVSGEEIAASLAPAWHDKGFTGKGVKVAVIDGGFKGLPELQAAGELPTNAITQDFCRRQARDRDASMARPWRRSSTRWLPTPSCTSSAWARKWISPPPSRTPRARGSRSSTSPWAGKAPTATTAVDRSERSSPMRGPAASSGSIRPETKRMHTGRARTTRRGTFTSGARTATWATRSSGRTARRSAGS